MKKQIIMAVCLLLFTHGAMAQNISTYAGTGDHGFSGDDSAATAAKLDAPNGIATDGSGNLYIVDGFNGRIRKVSPSGIITTFAGGGSATGEGIAATTASIFPYRVAVDGAGNVYVSGASKIRKINPSGIITTVAGTGTSGFSGDGMAATSAELRIPIGVAVDGTGNIYIADSYDNRVRKISSTGIISTIAGNGYGGGAGYGGYLGDGSAATLAQLNGPNGVAVDATGNVYFSDKNNHCIRMVNMSGIISTIAGTGTPGDSGDGGAATAALLEAPQGVAVDGSGNIYIAVGNRIRKITTSSGFITTVAGNGTFGYSGDGSPATVAKIASPNDVCLDGSGNFFISDYGNNVIRKVSGLTSTNTRQLNLHTDVALFPNPNVGVFTIRYSLNSKSTESISAKVLNMLGQVVYETNLDIQRGKIDSQISLPNNLVSGIYMFNIQSPTERLTLRLVIER